MQSLTRRDFLSKSTALGAGLSSLAIAKNTKLDAALRTDKDDISLAEWALNLEIKAGKFTNLDFPRIAREDFDINGIEFVNTLFEVPTYGYLKKLKKNAEDYNVKMPVLMVDDEGDPVHPSKKGRKQFVINHRKWIDIAHYLGCHSVRTNCRGNKETSKENAMNLAVESYNHLLEYAVPAKINIVIENHGGLSDDPEWMITLLEKVDNLYFGSYVDWRWRDPAVFDNYAYLKKLLPYAKGHSYKVQPSVEHFEKLIKLCRDSGYRGFYAIESKGRENIKFAKKIFEKVLFGKE